MLLVSIALAAPPTLHDDLLRRFEDESGQGGCLTGLVIDLRENWGLFSPAERARMTSILAPFKQDLVEEDGAPPPVANLGTDTCFGQYGENRLQGDHFQVEWDDGTVSQSVAQNFLDALEFGYEVLVEEEGWLAPDGDDRYLMLAYIQDSSTGGAYTTVDSCGGEYIPYIVAGRDAVQMGDWTEEMAAHELNHAIQFRYSFAPEFWWWEATATYIEEVVLPDTNGWASYITGYSQAPYIEMGASDQNDNDIFWHMYGMAIWGFYLADYHGGPDTVRETWENARSERGQYDYGAQDMVRDLGLNWQDTYVDFITRNVSMDYDQHRHFPEVSVEEQVRSFPAGGEGDGSTRPQGYGQNYIRVAAGAGAGDLHVTFSGDTDVDWAVVLAETDGQDVLRSEVVIAQDGAGEVTLTGYGDEDVYLIVSPLEEGDDRRDYTWEMELLEGDGGDDDDDTDVAGDDDDDDDVTDGDDDDDDLDQGSRLKTSDAVELQGTCGCASPGAVGPAAGWLLGLSLLAARRRK